MAWRIILRVLEKPGLPAELDGVGDRVPQRPAAPPHLLQLARGHRSRVIHVTYALPAKHTNELIDR